MENPAVTGLRSRSRSKTPFLRSSCDHENCNEVEEHTHRAGRKTPIIRSTPIKQLNQNAKVIETITEATEEVYTSPPAHRTRQSTRNASEKLVKTSDYSSEESLDRLKGHQKEIIQNEINNQYEKVSTSTGRSYSQLDDVTFSPIQTSYNLTQDRSTRFGSPAYSACSTDSSFAEQALADTSVLLNRNPNHEHLPSRLYKMAGEYWNKYPKTDYTYSPLSKDRVELAPGQVAMPNMSRRSLSQVRAHGSASRDEIDRLAATTAWTTTTLRKRYTSIESSDDEGVYVEKRAQEGGQSRWWAARWLREAFSAAAAAAGNAYRRTVGPSHRYPYTDRRPRQPSVLSRVGSTAAAPFYWIYTLITTVITTTVTTITETISPTRVNVNDKYIARTTINSSRRRWWPWAVLLLLPILGYGSHYTYENWDNIVVPNFREFQLDLKEFTNKLPDVTNITLSDLNLLPKINITMPEINITMPEINITMPDFSNNLPEVSKTYSEFKVIVQNRMADASDYMKVVADSCYEEMRRFWRGVLG